MSDQIVVSESALGYLQATRPWVKFLAILGFIFVGLMILMSLALVVGFSAVPGQPAFGAGFGILYLVFAGLYFMPCLFLYRYGKALTALPGGGQGAFEEALKSQKSFWKFIGMLTAIVLSIEVVIILIVVLASLALHK